MDKMLSIKIPQDFSFDGIPGRWSFTLQIFPFDFAKPLPTLIEWEYNGIVR